MRLDVDGEISLLGELIWLKYFDRCLQKSKKLEYCYNSLVCQWAATMSHWVTPNPQIIYILWPGSDHHQTDHYRPAHAQTWLWGGAATTSFVYWTEVKICAWARHAWQNVKVQSRHRSPVDSHLNGQWCGASMFSLICALTNVWTNHGDIGDLRSHGALYYVTVVISKWVGWWLCEWETMSHQWICLLFHVRV